MNQWKDDIDSFIRFSNDFGVRMIMVGGGAVNFHGYQRHSADVDFWIDAVEDNFEKLVKVFTAMGYEIEDFPMEVKERDRNISVKFSPGELTLELITRFSIGKSFEEAFAESEIAQIDKNPVLKWRVLSLDDLIASKLRSARPKDLLDIQEIRRIRGIEE